MKVSLRQKTKSDRTGAQPVYVRLSHLGRESMISLGVSVHPKHWNPKRAEVRATHIDAASLNALMQSRLADAQSAAHAVLLQRGKTVPIADVKAAVVSVLHPDYTPDAPAPPIVAWMRAEVKREFRLKGKEATALAYGSVLSNLEESLREMGKRPREVTGFGLTLQVLTRHRDRISEPKERGGAGHSKNYVHKQITTIRSLLSRAVRAGVTGAKEAHEAATLVEVRREKVERPRLPITEVRAYLEDDLTGRASDVRDWWCFAFYAGGRRLGDVCRLRWEHIERDAEGRPVAYRMRTQKTGARAVLPLAPEAQAIVRRWEDRTLNVPEESRSPYVFGLLQERDEEDPARLRTAVDRRGAIARKYLQREAEARGWPKVGFHTARHSLADHMRRSGADLYSISKVLQHTKIRTTEQYLAAFDEDTVGAALLKSLGGHGAEHEGD